MQIRTGRESGFTLIELMVVILVASILVGVAAPAYLTQVRKSRRTEAKTAILDLASREERLFSLNNSYSATAADVGYPVGAWPQNIGNNYYQVKVDAPAPAANAPATFTITATAINSQLKDTQCRSFVVDQSGKLTSADAGSTDSTTTCLN